MYNNNNANFLFEALRSFHTERLAQKEVIRRQQGALLTNVGDMLASFGAKLQALSSDVGGWCLSAPPLLKKKILIK